MTTPRGTIADSVREPFQRSSLLEAFASTHNGIRYSDPFDLVEFELRVAQAQKRPAGGAWTLDTVMLDAHTLDPGALFAIAANTIQHYSDGVVPEAWTRPPLDELTGYWLERALAALLTDGAVAILCESTTLPLRGQHASRWRGVIKPELDAIRAARPYLPKFRTMLEVTRLEYLDRAIAIGEGIEQCLTKRPYLEPDPLELTIAANELALALGRLEVQGHTPGGWRHAPTADDRGGQLPAKEKTE